MPYQHFFRHLVHIPVARYVFASDAANLLGTNTNLA